MDQVINLSIQYGPLAGLVVLLLIVIWGMSVFILNIYETRFKKFDEKFELYDQVLQKAASSVKIVSHENIQALQLESSLIRNQMEGLQIAVTELKSQVSKEIFSITKHSMQIHERSEQVKKMIDEALDKVGKFLDLKDKIDMAHGRVIVVENKVDRIDIHHRSNMQTIAEKIGKHAVEIANLKKGKE